VGKDNTVARFHCRCKIHLRLVESEEQDLYPGPASRVDTIARVLFGLCGASALLVPMVILAFITSPYYRLLVATLFIVPFALLVALINDITYHELMAASATYAAVLVVIVWPTAVSSP
jgi:hypothetical protein